MSVKYCRDRRTHREITYLRYRNRISYILILFIMKTYQNSAKQGGDDKGDDGKKGMGNNTPGQTNKPDGTERK